MSDIVERLRYGAICPVSGDGDGDKLEAASEIESLRQQLADAQREAGHWKNNHETEVRRARILKERTDMPIERVQAYERWCLDLAENAAMRQQLAEKDADIAFLNRQRDAIQTLATHWSNKHSEVLQQLAAAKEDASVFQAKITAVGKAATGYDFSGGLEDYVGRAFKQLAASQLREQQLREDHASVIGCIDAAYAEGLSERLAELPVDVGQIKDIVERRLLWAGSYSEKALALPTDTSALEALIAEAKSEQSNFDNQQFMEERRRIAAKAGEVMRERIIANLLRCGALGDGDYLNAIRALPGVTLEDLK